MVQCIPEINLAANQCLEFGVTRVPKMPEVPKKLEVNGIITLSTQHFSSL
jgi:hypothetical protein